VACYEGEDVLNTAKQLRAMGARVERTGPVRVAGSTAFGVAGFAAPEAPLDFGNSGTGCRLVMGAVAGCPITATFDGDASLRTRPMRRILDPLALMGAEAAMTRGGRAVAHHARRRARSAADRSIGLRSHRPRSNRRCCLPASRRQANTTVFETEASRDHTELMLRHFGAQLASVPDGEHGPQNHAARPA